MGYWGSIIYTCKQLSIQRLFMLKVFLTIIALLVIRLECWAQMGHSSRSLLSVVLVSVSAPPLPGALLF